MVKHRMPDVIVLLPGITGSQLRKNGEVVWGFSGGTLARSVLTRGGHLRRALTLKEDPPDLDDLDDGVVADRLLPDLHLLPGFWKIDGYARVSGTIERLFDVEKGRNFFHFPYDWRRDNRVAARSLERRADEWLRQWRAHSGNDEARLILIAHSMGGLVSRYFLEVLGGWKDTRALITFGTPYRGSLNALDTLANGMRKGPFGLLDLSSMARSFTSIYQLLPIYRCYDPGGGAMARLVEAASIPNVDLDKVQAARAFHREIEEAVESNQADDAYRERGYGLYPFVGIAQKTNQGARLNGDAVEMLHQDFQGEDRRGDGTVPRVSAVPQEWRSVDAFAKFSAVKHGSIQNSDGAHRGLDGILSGLYFHLGDFLAPAMAPLRIAMNVEDVYLRDEPIMVRAEPETPRDVRLAARLIDTSEDIVIGYREMEPDGAGGYSVAFDPLAEGRYVVEVDGSDGIEPTAEAFAVAGVGEEELAAGGEEG